MNAESLIIPVPLQRLNRKLIAHKTPPYSFGETMFHFIYTVLHQHCQTHHRMK